jgi:hypothetical protein
MKRLSILLLHAFLGWAMCGAIIGIGFKLTSEFNALIIHAAAVPVVFGLISLVYFRTFRHASALTTASIFLIFTMVMDFFLVALLIQKSFAMFYSVLGTWIPFMFIFLTTYGVGTLMNKRAMNLTHKQP